MNGPFSSGYVIVPYFLVVLAHFHRPYCLLFHHIMGADTRKEFYSRATHILFAIVLAHSFLLASEILVPISVAFQPENQMSVTTLLFSYLLIISGWIGYSRSVSYRPYKGEYSQSTKPGML